MAPLIEKMPNLSTLKRKFPWSNGSFHEGKALGKSEENEKTEKGLIHGDEPFGVSIMRNGKP